MPPVPRSRRGFVMHLDSSGPLTQAAFTAAVHIARPSQAETGRVVQCLCKKWEEGRCEASALAQVPPRARRGLLWRGAVPSARVFLAVTQTRCCPSAEGQICSYGHCTGFWNVFASSHSSYCHFCHLGLHSCTASASLREKVKAVSSSAVWRALRGGLSHAGTLCGSDLSPLFEFPYPRSWVKGHHS